MVAVIVVVAVIVAVAVISVLVTAMFSIADPAEEPEQEDWKL